MNETNGKVETLPEFFIKLEQEGIVLPKGMAYKKLKNMNQVDLRTYAEELLDDIVFWSGPVGVLVIEEDFKKIIRSIYF